MGNYIDTSLAWQAPAENFAARWVEAAEGFIAAFFWALAVPPTPAVDAVIQQARSDGLRLNPEDFPGGERGTYWSLARLLCGFAQARIRPTPEAILRAAQRGKIGLPGGGGDTLAELQGILFTCASAVHLPHYAHELKRFARKARQVRRLWGVLRDHIEDEAPAVSIPIISRKVTARRRSA